MRGGRRRRRRGFVLREVWAFQFPVKRQNDGLGEELEKKKNDSKVRIFGDDDAR